MNKNEKQFSLTRDSVKGNSYHSLGKVLVAAVSGGGGGDDEVPPAGDAKVKA
jgi:hypothetical protein